MIFYPDGITGLCLTADYFGKLFLTGSLDEQYTRTPCYGVLKMMVYLRTQGYQVNAKRVRRLLHIMGLEAVYRKPNTSQPNPDTRFILICCVG